jgi:hypothetical protein
MAMRVIPMNWYECGPELTGKIFGSSGKFYICMLNNGVYVWNDVTLPKNILVFGLLIVFISLAFWKSLKTPKKKSRKHR